MRCAFTISSRSFVSTLGADRKMQSNDLNADDETEHAAICSWIIEHCANETNPQSEIQFGYAINPQREYNDCLLAFHEGYVEALLSLYR